MYICIIVYIHTYTKICIPYCLLPTPRTQNVLSDTLRTWKWSPTWKGTCPFRHPEDLEVVPHPPNVILDR